MVGLDQAKQERTCPVCNATDYTPFAEERIDESKLNDFAYASRKEPEFMCLRLVCCCQCGLVYAPTPPNNDFLSSAYAEADFDSGDEASCAAHSYAKALMPYTKALKLRNAAVDVGAGSGPLLPLLISMGFNPVVGIEPSIAAINAAAESVKPHLREGMFDAALLSDLTPSLICSFMTLEHIENPGKFVQTAYDLLETGGMIAVVVHNRQGLLNRIMGLKSPIIDIEHLQLFNPQSVSVLLKNSGFQEIHVTAISNKYPLKYWLRLTPLPLKIKKMIIKTLGRFAECKIPMRVGNILAVGLKP